MATIKLHLSKISEGECSIDVGRDTIEKLKDCFYSDNCVTSVNSTVERRKFVTEASHVLQTANFELRGWQYMGDGDNCMTSVLGILWDKNVDTLSINVSFLSDFSVDKCTKRLMLSVAQRVFDAIGFTCPVMLCPKLLLQKTWDESVDDETNYNFESG